MPGLVVVADHGPGARTIPPGENDISPAADFFDKLQPAEAWNLAGLFHSSTYSLKGGSKQTSILAHINVPYGLFTPVVLVDKSLTNGKKDEFGVFCDGTNALYRLDGGPLTCAIGGLSMTRPAAQRHRGHSASLHGGRRGPGRARRPGLGR